MNILKGFSALILGFIVAMPAVATPVTELPDFSQLKVYGVQRPGLRSVSAAKTMLNQELSAKGQLSPAATAELHRYLVYDALNHYVAFLLHVTAKPDSDYFSGFSPLQEVLGADFLPLQQDAVQQAINITRKIRFDVSMVMLSTKHIYNAEEDTPIDRDIVTILSRLEKVSTKLTELYPASEGELPTTLIAFVASVFSPTEGKEPATCDQHLPEQLKSQVLNILATPQAELMSPVVASPATPFIGTQ